MSRARIVRDPVFLLVGAAIVWGIGLIVLAGTLPVVTPQVGPVTASATVTASGTVVTSTTSAAAPPVAEQARITLVRDSGYAVLGLAALPTVTALIVGLLVWRQAGAPTPSGGSDTARVVAWVLSAVVLLAGIVGFVTILIGVAVVPVGVLLLLACTQAALSRGSGSAPGRRATPSGVGA